MINKLEMQRITIPLLYSFSIIGNSSSAENIEIINNPSRKDIEDLEPEINSGAIKKIVVLKQANQE